MNTPEWEASALSLPSASVPALWVSTRRPLRSARRRAECATLETLAHLSLAPHCQRGWGSLYDALNAGTLDLVHLECLVAAHPLEPETTWLAVDASVWPLCDAPNQSGSGFDRHPYRHSHGQPIVAGWNYSWLAQVPRRSSSWTAPLRLRRIIPGENPNLVAAEQILSWYGQASLFASLPIFTFDAGYDAVQLSLALADLLVGLLVRLRAGRCFYADPTTQPVTPTTTATRGQVGL
jgi:hypothetical protein